MSVDVGRGRQQRFNSRWKLFIRRSHFEIITVTEQPLTQRPAQVTVLAIEHIVYTPPQAP